jgi:CRISPR-associated protein Csm2
MPAYRNHNTSSTPTLSTSAINFEQIDAQLFNQVALSTAKTISSDKTNKPTQLRRFYDEIVMWDNKIMMYPDKFTEYRPFILMLNAKTAYAKGRKLVDQNYVNLLEHCTKQVTNPETMRIFKLFMEAFMGFYKEKSSD